MYNTTKAIIPVITPIPTAIKRILTIFPLHILYNDKNTDFISKYLRYHC